MRIDHVIWATADLAGATSRLAAEHGLADVGGGRHEGIGTHNRVLPLGGGYLEVLAVAHAAEAARSPLGRAVAAAPEGLLGWAVAVDDVAAHAVRLDLPVTSESGAMRLPPRRCRARRRSTSGHAEAAG